MSSHLERLAKRVGDDPVFLAAALNRYAASEGLDDAALADKLTCPAEMLTALRLCRMPRSEAALFQQDVEQIVGRFSVNGEVLVEIVRRGLALIHLQGASAQAGLLLAARDRSAQPSPTPEGGSR